MNPASPGTGFSPPESDHDRFLDCISRVEAVSQERAREIERLRLLLYGARAGQHLYRAWQVLRGNPRYRWKPDANSVDPATVHGYHDLVIEGLQIRFHLAALADNRGTGRVARTLLDQFKILADASAGTPVTAAPPVHFFAAPHWGPATLPPRSCVVIHDAIPLATTRYPEQQRAVFERRCREVIRQADQLIAISRTAEDDIIRLLGAPREKIRIIPNGITRLPVAPQSPPALPASPYLVYVGGGEHHKNLRVVFEALGRPEASGIGLAMIGDNSFLHPVADVFRVADRVHFFGRLDDASVGQLITHSLALVFPSLHEGFGLPPLEAALLGIPSICSRRPAMTEFMENAALFAEPDAPGEWAQHIRALADSPVLRTETATRAYHTAAALDWTSASRTYVDALKSMSRP